MLNYDCHVILNVVTFAVLSMCVFAALWFVCMLFDQVEGKTTFYLIFALHEMIVANTDIGLNCSVIFYRRLVTWGECTSGTNLVLIKRSLPCNNSINKCSSRKQHLDRSFLNKNKQFNKDTKRVCRFQ